MTATEPEPTVQEAEDAARWLFALAYGPLPDPTVLAQTVLDDLWGPAAILARHHDRESPTLAEAILVGAIDTEAYPCGPDGVAPVLLLVIASHLIPDENRAGTYRRVPTSADLYLTEAAARAAYITLTGDVL